MNIEISTMCAKKKGWRFYVHEGLTVFHEAYFKTRQNAIDAACYHIARYSRDRHNEITIQTKGRFMFTIPVYILSNAP